MKIFLCKYFRYTDRLFLGFVIMLSELYGKSRKKDYMEEFVWGTLLFWQYDHPSMSYFLVLFPLPKWRTCWMALIKIQNIATGGVLYDDNHKWTVENMKISCNFWLASLRTWYIFRLCFNFSCSGNDLILIKKYIKLLFGFTKVFIINKNLQTRC